MTQSKADKIEEVKQNLPLPEQPPVPSDFNTGDATAVSVGSGRLASDVSTGDGSSAGLREPASQRDPDMSNIGREGKDNLSGPPKDAAAK